MNPIILFLSSIIIFGFLGTLSAGFSTVYHDVVNAVSSGIKSAVSFGTGIAKGLAQTAQNIFIGSFINYIVTPIVTYGSNGILDLIRYMKGGIGDIFGVLIGIPLGLINYITGYLNALGIFGLPVVMVITGIFIVVLTAMGLGIIKLVQALGELL